MEESMIMSGPILACVNAIEHYDKTIAQQVVNTGKLRQQVATSLDSERTLEAARAVWVKAKAALVQEFSR